MFADPLTLTIAAGSVVLKRVNNDNYGSEYRFRDSTKQYTLKIRHTVSNQAKSEPTDRHNVELTEEIFADGDLPAVLRKVYVVIEQTPSDQNIDNAIGLATFMSASSGANLTKLMGWES